MSDAVHAQDLIGRVNTELRAPLEGFVGTLGRDFIPSHSADERRRLLDAFIAAVEPATQPFAHIRRSHVLVPAEGADGGVRLRLYRPDQAKAGAGAVYFIHGGGFVLGSIESEDAAAAMLCSELGCLVASVDYRLAPEHPHPVPVEDCYAGLRWLAAHAADLEIDTARIAVYGSSAGGGLAASLALLARDRGGPPVALQILCCPMLDHRSETASCTTLDGLGIWDVSTNRTCWAELLGSDIAAYEANGLIAYASPARAADLTGLPAAYIDVGALDILLDEARDYAERLDAAGVPVRFRIYPGAYHGFDAAAPAAAISQRAITARLAALRRVVIPE